ncbi:hypothetical protein RJ45_00305 [Photobacterium gaetbulicola]|uniref:DUF218 domain-containing protein n=1 Tax=Photobacterium gaetbulicola TaxID=1295392 RepID=A0A0B9GAM8_9GAMM|nr:YdcF family protein [Photobacterium gaetbulicola]KHT65624.1 hypothetical protein RJ45_00305 [Photobacterium gaetbulicola]
MDYILRALDAYNSPHRHNFNLNNKTVSNLDAVTYYLSQALSATKGVERADTLITLANIDSFRGNIEQAILGFSQAQSVANHRQQITLHFYLALWHHYQGNIAPVSQHIEQLSGLDANSAQDALGIIAIIEKQLSTSICYHHNTHAPEHPPASQHAIITLGYKLNSDGTIARPLKQRLEKTLKLARHLPGSLIIVTGGLEVAGTTEAAQMKKWLVEHGIKSDRIIKEDQAANTIENARNSLAILQDQPIQHVTLVSASIHVHRTQILFETIQLCKKQVSSQRQNFHIAFDHLAVADGLSPDHFPSGQTRINCYIDALRSYGLPAFQWGDIHQI